MILKKLTHLILSSIISLICFLYIWLVALTSKIVYIDKNNYENFIKKNQSVIFAFWHNRQFFLTFAGRFMGIYVLISKSKDGDYIANTVKLFGFKTIRGSSSKGGVKALLQIVKMIKNGKSFIITPDGPRGPIYKAEPGIYHVASKTKAPIIPVSCSSSRKKIFNSWDKYELPLPFSNIYIKFGEPFYIHEFDNMNTSLLKVEDELNKNTSICDSFLLSPHKV